MQLALDTDLSAGPSDGPLAVLLHGFPELPSCWRAQAGALGAAGWRVIAPYLRGYGPSVPPGGPGPLEDYTAHRLVADLDQTLDAAGARTAVLIGHDWGAALSWAYAQLRPERIRAVAALSVPYTARSRRPPLQRFHQVMGGRFFYLTYFAQDPAAQQELEADPRAVLTGLYAAASGRPPAGSFRDLPAAGTRLLDHLGPLPPRPDWLPAADLDAAVTTFAASGFAGPLNYYRAMDLTWANKPRLGTLPVACPALFLAGDRDPVLAFTPMSAMAEAVPQFTGPVLLPGVGHWVQREAPERVSEELLSFLAALPGAPGS